MALKIEKVPLPKGSARHGTALEEFVKTVRDLKVGESFVFEGFGPYHRNAMSVLQYAYGRTYASRKIDDAKARVFRVS